MPTYVFQCPDCGLEIEARMTFEEIDRGTGVPCPDCGVPAHRVFLAPDIVVGPKVCDLPANRKGRYEQQKWIETPEVQKKLKTGEYRVMGKGE